MPELPEVETVRRGLVAAVGGRTVTAVEVTGARTVRRHAPDELAVLVGERLGSIDRHGKFLVLRFGGVDLVAHLRMSGQLRVHALDDERAPHTHARLGFGGTEVRFVDPRTFGELFVPAGSDDHGLPIELAALGPDALGPLVDARYLSAALRGRRAALKSVLLDQRVVAGIGNIYADEICFRAKVLPGRVAGTLGPAAIGRLTGAIREVLGEAVSLGGSTLRDARYRDVFGDAGAFQDRHAVYARTGAPCVACGTPIRRIRVAGRSAHFCPRCQR